LTLGRFCRIYMYRRKIQFEPKQRQIEKQNLYNRKMFKIKPLICSVAATVVLTFCAANAKAYTILGTVTNYSVLNVSLTCKTNAYVSTSTGFKMLAGLVTMSSKDVLKLLASSDFADETFPAGARLEYDWDDSSYGDEVIVTDKTGKNIIYVPPYSGYPSFGLYFDEETGAYSENYNENSPGFESVNGENSPEFWLYDDNSEYVYFWSDYGTDTENFRDDWNGSGANTSWTDSENYPISVGGDEYFGDAYEGSLSGYISAYGHGTSYPYELPIVYY
jgi:hypothetical protein